ncbi:MAG: hypothetical protein HY841_08855 [Bacteroidetes bacterium]|nr:hypothetical protein [Bacteroidota bacterium]
MEIIGTNKLKEISGYSDLRSIRKWVEELGAELHHIGKNYFVNKAEFESAVNNRYSRNKNVITKQVKQCYTPKSDCEKEFLADLTQTITKL